MLPIRSLSVSFGRCDILCFLTANNRSNDMDAISPTCRSPFWIGRPDTCEVRYKTINQSKIFDG